MLLKMLKMILDLSNKKKKNQKQMKLLASLRSSFNSSNIANSCCVYISDIRSGRMTRQENAFSIGNRAGCRWNLNTSMSKKGLKMKTTELQTVSFSPPKWRYKIPVQTLTCTFPFSWDWKHSQAHNTYLKCFLSCESAGGVSAEGNSVLTCIK